VKAQSTKLIGVAAVLMASLSSGCGDVARNGRAPVLAVISSLEAASGADPNTIGTTLRSDVVTLIERDDELGGDYYSTYNDIGQVTIRLTLRDPGIPGVTATPTPLNEVTFNRYRVTYRRADGRNTPGVDVPYPFDSAVTFTVPSEGEATAGFDIVRHVAKQETPLAALANSSVIISTIAEVQFFGRDQVGNEVIATGNIGIFFGNFADPE
jgi:hypothetical protein